MKNNLDFIYKHNKLKGFIYNKIYQNKINKLLNRLYENPVDVELLIGFFDFLYITRVHILDDNLKRLYQIKLYPDSNTIKIEFDSKICFIITVLQKTNINITYSIEGHTRFIYDVIDNLLNFDKRDKEKDRILSEINEKIIDIIIYSILTYFGFNKKG